MSCVKLSVGTALRTHLGPETGAEFGPLRGINYESYTLAGPLGSTELPTIKGLCPGEPLSVPTCDSPAPATKAVKWEAITRMVAPPQPHLSQGGVCHSCHLVVDTCNQLSFQQWKPGPASLTCGHT